MSDLGNKSVFAKNLTRYMESRGVDRNRLCSDLGLKYSTVSEWLSAKKYPRIDKIELLANYFDIQKSNLIEREADESFVLTAQEAKLIRAYRAKPNIQPAVDKLLDIEPTGGEVVRIAARDGGYKELRLTAEQLEKFQQEINAAEDFKDRKEE